jgi:hypothetical protein
MMGNGVLLKEGYQYTLAEAKEFVTRLTNLGLDTSKQKGIKIPICQESSYTLITQEGRSMGELYPGEYFWAQLLSAYGIANTYTTEKSHTGSIIAVSGQYFRNLSKEELTHLFINNFVILEGDAAYTLWDMGYGHLAGIDAVEWHKVNSGVQAYEETCNNEIYSGIKNSRMSSQCSSGNYLRITYTESANIEKLTEVKGPDGSKVGPGMVLYKEMNDHKKRDQSLGINKCEESLLKSYSERYDALVHDGEVVLSGIEPGTFGYDELRKMLARLRDYKYAYMLFIRDYNAPFTNNLAERDLRPCKTRQKISGCFRTWRGISDFVKIMSVISTWKKQKMDLFVKIKEKFIEPHSTFTIPSGQ